MPVPDPTERTNQALLREMASLREILLSRIDGQRDVFDARISGMDKAITLLQTITDRQSADVDKKVGNLERLHQEKFNGIHTQFVERDVRVEQTARDTKTAVDAALAAQEKAAGKQADAFTKQIDALDDKISDIRDRQITSEGTGKGRSDVWGYVMAVVMALIAIAAVFRGHI